MNFMTKYYRSPKYICSVLRRFVFIISFFAGLWLFSSCEEPPTMIGGEILPIGDYISILSIDTFRIESYTSYDPRIRTDALKSPFIGVYSDPYFGTTTMGFVTQLRLEEKFSDIRKQLELEEGDWVVDSVKLFLRVMSNYGSNDNFNYLRISEISDMLYNNTPYYFNDPVNTTGFGVSAIIPPLRSDTINDNIRITLPKSFGEYLIRDTSMLFYTTNPNEKDFRDYFKGFYFTIPSASAADPFLLGFDFNYDEATYDYKNYFIVYISDREKPTYTTYYRFLLDSRRENARYTTIKHDFSTLLEGVINKEVIDTLSYVQGLYGAYTTIFIPGLETLKETIKNDPRRARSAVNKARLIAPVYLDNYTYTDTTVAQRLIMRYVNAEGEKEIVPDYFVDESSAYFDGVLDTAKYVYNFNLSNFVQNYFKDTENKLKPELEIFLPANSARNSILKANDSKTPLKFELTLTDY